MFDALATKVIRRPRLTLVIWAALAALLLLTSLSGLGGQSIFDRLKTSQGSIPGSSSDEGQQVLNTLTGQSVEITLLVTGVNLADSATAAKVDNALAPVHKELIARVGDGAVVDPFVLPGKLANPAATKLMARNKQGFLLSVTISPEPGKDITKNADAKAAFDASRKDVERRLARVPQELRAVSPNAAGTVSDQAIINQELVDQVSNDMRTGELLVLPLTLLIMVLVFGGFMLAGMPLAGALVSICAALGSLWGLSYLIDIESSVLNIVTVIGLGLSIDYGLLFTSRYREELGRLAEKLVNDETPAAGVSIQAAFQQRRARNASLPAQAVRLTMVSAGRTILFSAVTVAIGLLGLALMPPTLLSSIGVGGLFVTLIAVAAALTLVPALLLYLGTRALLPSWLQRVPLLGKLQARIADVSSTEGIFSRLARWVHRYPWYVLVACVAALGAMCVPLGNLHLLNSGTDLLPRNGSQYAYLQTLKQQYPDSLSNDATLIMYGNSAKQANFIKTEVSQVADVQRVQGVTTAGDYTVAYLELKGTPGSRSAEQAVVDIRSLNSPSQLWITGQAATQVDFGSSVISSLPWLVPLVLGAIFILLFLMTGSLLVPIKAVLINSLSLAASLGLATWIFQGGHGVTLLGFTPIGGMESYVMVVAIVFGFGLAMDYEVFLLGRIKEFWDASGDNDLAVEQGLQRSGRIITSAAAIMTAVFLGFVGGQMLVIKEIGLTLALIVLVDATIVRMALVPATMTLLGRWNWWSPAPIRAIFERYSIQH